MIRIPVTAKYTILNNGNVFIDGLYNTYNMLYDMCVFNVCTNIYNYTYISWVSLFLLLHAVSDVRATVAAGS